MANEDTDFTFHQAGLSAGGVDLKEGMGMLGISKVFLNDKISADNVVKREATVGSLSFSVIDTTARNPPEKAALNGSITSLSGPQQQKAPAKSSLPRAKVPLEKGYSYMDWLKITQTHPDLAVLKGQSNKRTISMNEVKQHKTGDAMWTVFKGRVYNIAPYMKFHPGGVDMLMKAVGKDCTSLFNEYHAWVNAEGMLDKCLVGTLETRYGPSKPPPGMV